jgi:putative restriction endonuclease
MQKRNWTREELILTFSLYCKLNFGQLHSRNPEIIKLSNIIGRTASAVALKLVNFSSFDPELKKRGIKGMGNASKLDKIIFDEFHKNWGDLLLESELLNDYYSEKDSTVEIINPNIIHQIGEERIATTKIRVNQHLFRRMVLSNYDETCSICNLDCPPLLVASHILPWSKNEKERLNPHNGLCLCSIHDKAFDKGLIAIRNDFTITPSKSLFHIKNEDSFKIYFGNFLGKEINMPRKFHPSIDFLAYHRDNIFLG